MKKGAKVWFFIVILTIVGLMFSGLIITTSATSEKTTINVLDSTPWFTIGCHSNEKLWWWSHQYEDHDYISTYVGGMSRLGGSPSEPNCWARFKPYLSQPGKYEVYAYFYACKNTSTKVPFTVKYDGGSTTIKVNQYRSPSAWKEEYLGTWYFKAGQDTYVEVTDATGERYDEIKGLTIGAIKFVKVFSDEKSIKFKTGDFVRVIADAGWNIRTEPKLGDVYIRIPPSPLPKGSEGQIMEHQDNGVFNSGHYWWYLRFGDYEGWCAEDGLELSTKEEFIRFLIEEERIVEKDLTVTVDGDIYIIAVLKQKIDPVALRAIPDSGEVKVYLDTKGNPVSDGEIARRIGLIDFVVDEVMATEEEIDLGKKIRELEQLQLEFSDFNLKDMTLGGINLVLTAGGDIDKVVAEMAVIKSAGTALTNFEKIKNLAKTQPMGIPIKIITTIMRKMIWDPMSDAKSDLENELHMAIAYYESAQIILNQNSNEFKDYQAAQLFLWNYLNGKAYEERATYLFEKIFGNWVRVAIKLDFVSGSLTSGLSDFPKLIWEAKECLDWTSDIAIKRVIKDYEIQAIISFELLKAAPYTLDLSQSSSKVSEYNLKYDECINDGYKEAEKLAIDLTDYLSGFEINKYFGFIKQMRIFSPGEIRVYDSQGKITGIVNGKIKEEIPNSIYDETGIVIIFYSKDSYRYEVIGTDTGTYGLAISSLDDGNATTFTATDVPTTPGAIHQYTIDWAALSQGEKGVTVKIDSDSDGVFEKTVIADNKLSQEELTPTLPVHNTNTGKSFSSIQAAVDAASAGDTIIVRDGTYTENVDIDKSITLKSSSGNPGNTIVQAANPNDHIFEITADYVNISGFTVGGAAVCIFLNEVNYCNISNNHILNYTGIYLNYSNDNIIMNNNFSKSDDGILLDSSNSNTVFNNTFSGYSLYSLGIGLKNSTNNLISDNTICNCPHGGIELGFASSNNIILNNTFKSCGLCVWSYEKNTVEGNTVNDKPLIYLENVSQIEINNAGQVILINCELIKVIGCNLSSASVGVNLLNSSNCVIENNICRDNFCGGIDLFDYSSNNIVLNNIIDNNFWGIFLNSYARNNTIVNNICENNYFGIHLSDTNNNRIYLNNLNNDCNVQSYDSCNIWNSKEKITYTYNGKSHTKYMGNYWSDYTGSDANKNGIGDIPYSIDDRGGDIDQDYYPLMTWSEHYTWGDFDESNKATCTNTLGMEFVLIPAGEFEMGSPSDEEGRYSNEGPVHHVNIEKAFYMGRYEVTQKQWREIMGENPSYFEGDDNLPVEQVSWDDVQEFIRKLNAKEGTNKYRLPSEAEWEYACRAGTTTRYSFGDSESKLGDYAWYYNIKNKNLDGKAHPVGQKKPNSWELYDMHGNVWEWVQDKCHYHYNGAPADGSAWGSGDGARQVLRGGSWVRRAGDCRSAIRRCSDPRYRFRYLGFRVLKEQ